MLKNIFIRILITSSAAMIFASCSSLKHSGNVVNFSEESESQQSDTIFKETEAVFKDDIILGDLIDDVNDQDNVAKLDWNINDGVLTIHGDGKMPYYEFDQYPWYDISYDIEKLIIEDGITSISDSAFEYCLNLREVTLAKSVKTIDDYAFYGCFDLESIQFSEGLKSIGKNAFWKCKKLTDINLPISLERIDDLAFYGCENVSTIFIPSNISIIGINPFAACTNLESITVDEKNNDYCSVNNLLYKSDCSELISYPSCKKDKVYILPESTESVGEYAMCYNNAITEIIMPRGLKYIGYYAFGNCSELTSAIIPNTIEFIGDNPFSGCDNIDAIVMEDNDYYQVVDGVLFTKDMTELVSFPNGKHISEYVIPDTVLKICNNAFTDCSSIESVILPDGLKIIGDIAFAECSISSLELPQGVEYIGDLAFYRCKFQRVTIPSSVTNIGYQAFTLYNDKVMAISGAEGSCAEKYASDNNFNFYNTVDTD